MRTSFFFGAAMIATLTSTSALAVVGGEADRLAPDQREYRIATDAIQERLAQQPAWQGFLDRHGPDWTALFDEATRTPVRFWGSGWDVNAAKLATDEGAFAIAMDILAAERQLLGDVSLSDLAPLPVDRKQGITTVSFTRTWNRLPAEDARVSLRFKAGRFVMGQLESMPGIDLRVLEPSIDSAQATADALAEMEWAASESLAVEPPNMIVYPIASAQSVEYRLAWKLELRSSAFPSHRLVYMDAGTGELLGWREQVRFIDGSLAAEHDDRYPDNGMITSPLGWAEASVNGQEVETDGAGGFTVDAGGTVTWTAGSRHFRVRNSGDVLAEFSGELSTDGDTLVAVPDPELDESKVRRVLAQLDTHVAAHMVRDRALRIDPGFGWASTRVDATVNSDDRSCNAWFDGDINFVREADGCNNTGRLADVVFHEYGHGFHAYSIIDGVGGFDGALSEGMGDYMAATITGDPATARGFFKGSDDPLRDIEINRVWPEDVGEIHQTGRIIAGALWDARKALVSTLGEQAGIDHADQLFLAIASRASDIPTAYAEAILADDDNGNLADGTPNQCLIDDAFGIHGLGPAADDVGLFAIAHGLLDSNAPADQGVRIEADVTLARPMCTTGEASEVRLLWSHGTDEFETLTMDAANGDTWAAEIPGAPVGTEVRYRIEVYDDNGDLSGMIPRGSITDPWFATFTGEPVVLFEADFEENDGGFVHDLIQGNADSEGADDWQWGVPGGLSGDPLTAWSGEMIWGNDLSPEENWNGAYQPNVHNVLASPVIDVAGEHEAVYLQFRRWLTVEDGFFDSAAVSVNGATVWTQYAGGSENDASNHHEDEHWAFRSYDITDLVTGGTAQVTWELISDGGLQLGGWNLDDVRIVAIPSLDGAADLPIEGEGCGCASSGSQAPGAGALLASLFLIGGLRRRRE